MYARHTHFVLFTLLGFIAYSANAEYAPGRSEQSNAALVKQLETFKGSRETILFSDDFELGAEFGDFFKRDYSRYTHFNKIPTSNRIEIVNTMAFRGQKSLMLIAAESNSDVSKASLEKEQLDFREGDIVKMAAMVFIPSKQNLKDLFLFDLECVNCWNKGIFKNPHMGIRLMLRDELGFVSIERGKIGFRNEPFYPIKPWKPFPEDRWVKLDWVLNLSTKVTGQTAVYIDNELVLWASGINMPNVSPVYKLFGLGASGQMQYDKFEFGITANGFQGKTTIYMDDISISRLDKMPR